MLKRLHAFLVEIDAGVRMLPNCWVLIKHMTHASLRHNKESGRGCRTWGEEEDFKR